MTYRTIGTLRAWVAEFEEHHSLGASAIRVIPQDGEAEADTGLVAVRLLNSPTEIYIEPPARAREEWMITFEPRTEYVRLRSADVELMATGVSTLAQLCSFLQLKSDRFGFEPEITAKIAKRKNPAWRVYELPISYSGRTYEDGKKIGLKDAFTAFYCIVRYWLFD